MISVIVPIYNVERYLKPCIESILASTYQDFELILVDDGSTDSSGKICDRYAERDERIRAIHKNNGGISDARNVGLKTAIGDYLCFVDGDDVIHPNMLQVLFDAITGGDYDFSMVLGVMVDEGAYRSFMEDRSLGLTAPQRVSSQREMFMGLMGPSRNNFQYMVVWNKMYKLSLIGDLLFRRTGSEDMEWNTRVFLRMKKAIVIDAPMYYYVQHSASITHQGMNHNAIDRINSYLIALESIPVTMPAERSMCLEKLYKALLHTRLNACHTKYKEDAKKLVESTYKATIQEYGRSKISWPKKYSLLLFYHVPWFYSLFMQAAEMKAKLMER